MIHLSTMMKEAINNTHASRQVLMAYTILKDDLQMMEETTASNASVLLQGAKRLLPDYMCYRAICSNIYEFIMFVKTQTLKYTPFSLYLLHSG